MSNLATLFTATQGALNTETFLFQDGPFGCVTEAGLYSRRVSRYTRGVQKHEALLDFLRNSLVLATAGLPHTLQAFCEFESHVSTMVNNMGVIVIEKHLQRKIQEKI